MVKKIRFPLSLSDGAQARSLDELKEHFDLEAVAGHYKSGKLLTWLRDRYIETEADAVEALDESAPDFQQKLCAIFGAEFSGADVDIEEIVRRQERMKKLREFTDEDEFIRNIDAVAFDQEDLVDLLDEGCGTIYLCGETFTVPASQKGKAYIGVNSPRVKISGSVGDDWESRNITFSGCEVEGLKKIGVHAEAEETAALDDSIVETMPIEIADRIYRQVWRSYGCQFYVETQDYILREDVVFTGHNSISAISKKSGNEFIVEKETEIHNSDQWAVHHNTVFACSHDGEVCKIDIEKPSITSLGFRAGDTRGRLATNGQYLAFSNGCKIVCIDMENRKKYVLKRELYAEDSPVVCAKDAVYFVSHNLDDSGKAVELIEFSLADKIERVVTKIQVNSYDATAISFYKHKIFLMFKTDTGIGHTNYNLGYVDLSADVPQYQCVCKNVCIRYQYTTLYKIYKYDRGWFFASKKANYPIEKFDFETMEFTTIAEGCGYSEHHSSGLFGLGSGYFSHTPNKIVKIGQWLYFRQGEKGDTVRISLNQPMQIEPLREEVAGVDL